MRQDYYMRTILWPCTLDGLRAALGLNLMEQRIWWGLKFIGLFFLVVLAPSHFNGVKWRKLTCKQL